MTTLIFATATAASPLIRLDAADAGEVRWYLAERSWSWHGSTPGLAAILFLRGLSPDQFDDWAPTLESVPILDVADALDWVDIVWNTRLLPVDPWQDFSESILSEAFADEARAVTDDALSRGGLGQEEGMVRPFGGALFGGGAP